MVQIRNRLGMFACAVALSFAGVAQAAEYDVSYTFGDGRTVSGTFNGELVGSTLENISSFSLSIDGVAFSGAATTATWDPSIENFSAAPATLSTDASANEFYITDGTLSFEFINDDNVGGQFILASNLNLDTNNTSFDSPANASWSITAVPETSSAALLLAGLGLVGAAARRRRSI